MLYAEWRERRWSKTDLSKITTYELMEELKKRDGVEAQTAEPYKDLTVSVNGPAVVLVVID